MVSGAGFDMDSFRAGVEAFLVRMLAEAPIADVALGGDKWTLKEMVGHLIDSASNEYLLHLVSSIESACLGNCWVKDGERLTLEFLIVDYFDHLRLHLDMFDRRAAEIRGHTA